MPSEKLGRCLGPAKNQGNLMSQYILTEAGEVIPIQTLRGSLTESEKRMNSKGSLVENLTEESKLDMGIIEVHLRIGYQEEGDKMMGTSMMIRFGKKIPMA